MTQLQRKVDSIALLRVRQPVQHKQALRLGLVDWNPLGLAEPRIPHQLLAQSATSKAMLRMPVDCALGP